MQLLEHWDPLNMPRGSVRALITLALLGTLFTLMAMGRPIPMIFSAVILLVLGHYFGSRSPAPSGEEKPPAPLGLPRGTIRTLIIAGYGTITWFLWKENRLAWDLADPNIVLLAVSGAMIAGYLIRNVFDLVTRRKASKPRRWYENSKAILALLATGLLVFSCIVGKEGDPEQNAALLAAPIIGFYYGSRH